MLKDLVQLKFLKGSRSKVIGLVQIIYGITAMILGHLDVEAGVVVVATGAGILAAADHDKT